MSSVRTIALSTKKHVKGAKNPRLKLFVMIVEPLALHYAIPVLSSSMLVVLFQSINQSHLTKSLLQANLHISRASLKTTLDQWIHLSAESTPMLILKNTASLVISWCAWSVWTSIHRNMPLNILSKPNTVFNDLCDREAADEVMSAYRSILDKINGARDKTEGSINKIKGLMGQAEQETFKVEGVIRSKCS